MVNPLSPHDALKHHATSLKTDLISLQLRSFRREISEMKEFPLLLFFLLCVVLTGFSPNSVEKQKNRNEYLNG